LKKKPGRPPGSTKITPEIVEGLFQHIIIEGRGVYDSCALIGISYSTLWRWRQRAQQGKKRQYQRLNRIFVYLENLRLEALQAKQAEVLRRYGYLN
jgi:transposase-like protein